MSEALSHLLLALHMARFPEAERRLLHKMICMDRRTLRASSMGGAKPHRGPGTSPGDMEPIIAGRDLRKSWGPTLVLEHADFLIHPNGGGVAMVTRAAVPENPYRALLLRG